jgi:hypothetical protein
MPTVSGDVGVALWLNGPLGISVLPLNVVSKEYEILRISYLGLGDSSQEFDAAHAVPTVVFKSRLRAVFFVYVHPAHERGFWPFIKRYSFPKVCLAARPFLKGWVSHTSVSGKGILYLLVTFPP